MRIYNERTGSLLGDRIQPALTEDLRVIGLLDRIMLLPGEGLWIKPCQAIHTVGMQFSIDVALLDKFDRVIQAWNLPPGYKISCTDAFSALELPAGTLQGTVSGDKLVIH
jgi:uncharacterized protein